MFQFDTLLSNIADSSTKYDIIDSISNYNKFLFKSDIRKSYTASHVSRMFDCMMKDGKQFIAPTYFLIEEPFVDGQFFRPFYLCKRIQGAIEVRCAALFFGPAIAFGEPVYIPLHTGT